MTSLTYGGWLDAWASRQATLLVRRYGERVIVDAKADGFSTGIAVEIRDPLGVGWDATIRYNLVDWIEDPSAPFESGLGTQFDVYLAIRPTERREVRRGRRIGRAIAGVYVADMTEAEIREARELNPFSTIISARSREIAFRSEIESVIEGTLSIRGGFFRLRSVMPPAYGAK